MLKELEKTVEYVHLHFSLMKKKDVDEAFFRLRRAPTAL